MTSYSIAHIPGRDAFMATKSVQIAGGETLVTTREVDAYWLYKDQGIKTDTDALKWVEDNAERVFGDNPFIDSEYKARVDAL